MVTTSTETTKNADKITSSALDLFKKKGYDKVTVSEICNDASVGRSSFYAVFSGKADIIAHMMDRVKPDFNELMPEFLKAPNDFERIMMLTNSYLKLAEFYGPDIVRVIIRMELSGKTHFLKAIYSFNDWLTQLIINCQCNNIIGNKSPAPELLHIQFDIAEAELYAWVSADGSWSLTDRVRSRFYTLLEVNPEYRRSTNET